MFIQVIRFSTDYYRILDQLTGLYFDLTRELCSWGVSWVRRNQDGELFEAVQAADMGYALRKLWEMASCDLRELRSKI